MGGFQVHFWRFSGGSGAANELEPTPAVNAGYDYIEKFAPVQRSGCKQLRWVDIERQRPESPIFGWTTGRINSAIASIRESGQQAETEQDYPLYVRHFEQWFQDMFKEWLPVLNHRAMM